MDRQRLIADLRRWESVRPRIYDDATGKDIVPGSTVQGHPSIGIGRRCDLPLSSAAIDFLVDEDITNCIDALDIAVPWWALSSVPEPVQRALVELTFTMGITGLLRFHRLLAAIQAGNFEDASRELAVSRWSRQVHETRSARLQAQLRGDQRSV